MLALEAVCLPTSSWALYDCRLWLRMRASVPFSLSETASPGPSYKLRFLWSLL